MPTPAPPQSARRAELLELAYRYVLEHGLAELSLRPLAAAIGSSTGVLMFVFGSKDGLLTALLARARADELAVLDGVRANAVDSDLRTAAEAVWDWLVAPRHRAVLGLWLEAYARSLIDPDGPWAGFAAATVRDWLALLDGIGPDRDGNRTLLLAVLRGGLLDLLATGDVERVDGAVRQYLAELPRRAGP
ncbi:MAG TPA: TetR/AcrR family transcriptional regulator [Pseudonocardia sp.]|nr:TetR/AcrR family transcriptional regulator [Pseudonocardia sp.]